MLSETTVSIEMLSIGVGIGAMESVAIVIFSFFDWGFFLERRLKYCSNPTPLETTKLVALLRLTGMTELSVSVCEV